MFKKSIVYFLGLLIMALGATLTIKSNMGTSSFDALCVGLSKNTRLSIGQCCVILGIGLICINSIFLKEKPNLYSFLTSLLAGFMIDCWMKLLQINSHSFSVRILIFFIGITINSMGIAVYIKSGLARGPIDNFMIAIKKVTKTNLMVSKLISELILISLALLMRGSIGVGTIVIAILSGTLIQIFHDSFGNIESFLLKN